MQVGITVAFAVSNLGVPLPVRVTQHIGPAVVVREGEAAEALAARVHAALQGLIDAKQRRRHRSYVGALASRFPCLHAAATLVARWWPLAAVPQKLPAETEERKKGQ